MAWDRKLLIAAWAIFCLMWIPLGMDIWYDISGGTSQGFDDTLMYLFLAMLFLFIILLITSLFGPLLLGMREAGLIRESGTLVPATILKISDTGIYINSQPVLELAITVHPPHEAAFEATIRQVIPFSAIPQVQPGAQLQVWCIPGTTRVAMQE